MPIDLSIASDDGLILILLRVPIKDLIEKCTQVSPQWNRILSENFFWREKMDYDGYHLDWRKLAGISTKSFQTLALKHCFNQNFIKDNWNLAVRSLTIDPRWIHLAVGDIFAPIEIPPEFVDGQPEIPPGYDDKPIEACVSVGREIYRKLIVINLADEGLTNEIMDKFRPTIVVSEMIGNRRDCAYTYQVKCSLEERHDTHLLSQFWCEKLNEVQREIRKEFRDKDGRWVGATIVLRSYQGQAEGWHRMEITFKNYPAGMRYLTLSCVGIGNDQNARGLYGLKLADCSVKALFEKNATE